VFHLVSLAGISCAVRSLDSTGVKRPKGVVIMDNEEGGKPKGLDAPSGVPYDGMLMLHRYQEDIVNSLECGLMVVDLRGMIVLFNRTAGEITGESCGTVLLSRADSIRALQPFANLMEDNFGQPVRRGEIEIVTRSGERKVIGVSTYPMKRGIKVIGVIAVFSDLTEVEGAEERVGVPERPTTEAQVDAGISASEWGETLEDHETEERESVLVEAGDPDL